MTGHDPEGGEEAGRSDPVAPPTARWVELVTTLLLFLTVLAVYLATANYTMLQNPDTRGSAQAAWSLGTRGSLELPTAWDPSDVAWAIVVENTDGGRTTFVRRFPGATYWAAPFYAVHAPFTDTAPPDHPDDIPYGPAAVAAATAAALAVVVTYRLFRRLADRRASLVGALTVAFATSVWSISGTALWTHGLTHLFLSLGVLATASRRYAAGGLAFALGVLSRPHTAVVPAVVGLHQAWVRRSLRPATLIGLTSMLGVLALALHSQVTAGTWVPVAGYSTSQPARVVTTGASTSVTRIIEFLVSPRRGLLTYAPFLLVLLPWLPRAWRTAPPWVRGAAAGGFVYTLVQLRVNAASGGVWFFAYRLPIELLVLSAPLLLVAWSKGVRGHRFREWLLAATIAVAVGLQILGATVHSDEYFDALRRGAGVSGPRVVEVERQ